MHDDRDRFDIPTKALIATVLSALTLACAGDQRVMSVPAASSALQLVEFREIEPPYPAPDDWECLHFVARSPAELYASVPEWRSQPLPIDFDHYMLIGVAGTCRTACRGGSDMVVDRIIASESGWRVEATWYLGHENFGDCIGYDVAYVEVRQSDVPVTFNVTEVFTDAP